MKVVPVSVTVTTPMAVTLFMDSADVRLAGWVSILGCLGPRSAVELYSAGGDQPDCLLQACAATCPAQRAFGEPTAAIPVPAKMVELA